MGDKMHAVQTVVRRLGKVAGSVAYAALGQLTAELWRDDAEAWVHVENGKLRRQVAALTTLNAELTEQREAYKAAWALMFGPAVELPPEGSLTQTWFHVTRYDA